MWCSTAERDCTELRHPAALTRMLDLMFGLGISLQEARPMVEAVSAVDLDGIIYPTGGSTDIIYPIVIVLVFALHMNFVIGRPEPGLIHG